MSVHRPVWVDSGSHRLAGELTPHAGARQGLVVVRTPYDRRRHRDLAASLARRGWDCLVQDVRGRHGSAGAWHPYRHEAEDGLATLAWAAGAGLAEAGRVVLYGASYAAHTALETARVAPVGAVTAVVALVPALGRYETAHDVGGAPQHLDRLGWWARYGFAREDLAPLPPAVLASAAAVAAARGPQAAARELGWGAERLDRWRELWSAAPLDLDSRYGAIETPLLVVTGDQDPFDGWARRLATAWGVRARTGAAALVSGPWGHDLAARDPGAARVAAGAGGPGARVLDWLAGRGPRPGQERRLDVALGAWRDRPAHDDVHTHDRTDSEGAA